MGKIGMKQVNGKWLDVCDYKNCKSIVFQEDGKRWIVCKKHIGQAEKDFNKSHIKIGNMIFKTDKKTAKIFNGL